MIFGQYIEKFNNGDLFTTVPNPQVHATDIDEGPNAQVVYSLLDRTNFEVNPVTGWISANRIFDREERDSYQVKQTNQGI